MDKKQFLTEKIQESVKAKQSLENDSDTIIEIASLMTKCLQEDSTIYFCGNGGSAADSQHVSAEFVGRFNKDRKPLAAEALTTNTSILTAVGNDYSFEEIFSRQVTAKVTKSDIVVGISTSGKSKNVLNALESAKQIGATVIGFTGINPGPMKEICDVCLCVNSASTPRIQESHIFAWHVICDLVETELFP